MSPSTLRRPSTIASRPMACFQVENIRASAEDKSDLAAPGGGMTAPRCPSCRSLDLVTTSKVVSADAYWRCCACGEVWNAGRLRTARGFVREGSYRR